MKFPKITLTVSKYTQPLPLRHCGFSFYRIGKVYDLVFSLPKADYTFEVDFS